MKVTVDKRSKEIIEALQSFSPEIGDNGGVGTFWIKADDGAEIGILVSYDHTRLHELHSELVVMRGMTDYVYLVTGPASNSQLLPVQELGVFTVTFGAPGNVMDAILSGLTKFVEFVSNGKRRLEKKVNTQDRIAKAYSPGEQMLMCAKGVGASKLGFLLNHFGSVAWAICGLTWFETAAALDGVITPQMISDFRESIQLDDGMVLSPVMKEG